jgi:hypothetical protein
MKNRIYRIFKNPLIVNRLCMLAWAPVVVILLILANVLLDPKVLWIPFTWYLFIIYIAIPMIIGFYPAFYELDVNTSSTIKNTNISKLLSAIETPNDYKKLYISNELKIRMKDLNEVKDKYEALHEKSRFVLKFWVANIDNDNIKDFMSYVSEKQKIKYIDPLIKFLYNINNNLLNNIILNDIHNIQDKTNNDIRDI